MMVKVKWSRQVLKARIQAVTGEKNTHVHVCTLIT